MTREESVFAGALGKGSGPERDAYLDEACAADPDLRRSVAALLRAHELASGILKAPVADPEVPTEPPPAGPGVGSAIGPYKLLEQIGGGGMGVVYMAEQVRPLRRKVALKLIKPGMDSGQVIARFEAERQALTMMDHPNIAKVLDAGTTEAGRPAAAGEQVPLSTALAGGDYTATSGMLTFAAGQTTRTFTVAITGDDKGEYTESFYVRLTNASSNAWVEYEYAGTGTILDNDRR